MSKQLIKLLKENKILKTGEFVLRSGLKSNYYCDIKEAFGNPKILNILITELTKIIPIEATCIAGCGYGGITLASLIAYKKKLPLVLVRDKTKDYGTKKVIDGYIPNKQDIICIIDDVYTTGSSIKDIKDKILPLKAKFTQPVIILNRSKKSTIISILTEKDLK